MGRAVHWPVLRLIWESRGHKLEAVADTLQKRFPGREGLSSSTIQRLTRNNDEAPEDVAELILALPVLPKSEETAEVVRLGFAMVERGPLVDAEALAAHLAAQLPKVEPEIIAAAVAAVAPKVAPELIAAAVLKQLPAPEAPKLDTNALAAEIAAQLPTLDTDAVAAKVAASVPAPPTATEVAAAVAAAAPKTAALATEEVVVARSRALARAIWTLAGVMALGFAGLAFLILRQATPVASQAPRVVVNLGTGGSEQAATGKYADWAWVRRETRAAMGQRKTGRRMPHEPLPGQALAPCRGSETTLYGACWLETAFKAPCPEDQFQEGDKCYGPIKDEPRTPLGNETNQRTKESR